MMSEKIKCIHCGNEWKTRALYVWKCSHCGKHTLKPEPKVLRRDKVMKPITYDDVLRLRAEGREDDAQKILLAFRENCTANKKQLSKELISRDRLIIKTLKKKQGICTQCSQPAERNRTKCGKCLGWRN